MLEPYFILINHIRLECWYNGHSSPLRLINKSFIEMRGKLLEDLAAVFCWYALLPHASPISIPFLRIHFWSIWLHCMREVGLTHTHRKAAGYETHLCTLRISSSLTSNELLSFVRQGSNSALYTGRTKLGCNLILISYLHVHSLKELLTLCSCSSICPVYGYVLFTCSKHGSFSNCPFSTKIDSYP